MIDLVTRVDAVFYWRQLVTAEIPTWHADPDSAPIWACDTVDAAIARMVRNEAALVRAEDAATVDAWLAERGATVLAVGA